MQKIKDKERNLYLVTNKFGTYLLKTLYKIINKKMMKNLNGKCTPFSPLFPPLNNTQTLHI